MLLYIRQMYVHLESTNLIITANKGHMQHVKDNDGFIFGGGGGFIGLDSKNYKSYTFLST